MAQPLDKVKVVAGEEHRVALGAMLAHIGDDLRRGLRVETHHGLVEHPQLGLVDERGDDADLLLHAVGVRLDLLVDGKAQFEKVEISLQPLRPVRLGHAVEVGDIVDIFPARQLLVDGVVVGDIAHVHLGLDGILLDVVAAHLDGAALEGKDAGEALDGGGFPRAVLTEEAEDLAGTQFEGNVVDCDAVALGIDFSEVFYFKHNILLLFLLVDSPFGGVPPSAGAPSGARAHAHTSVRCTRL